ncbi:MAG TPA: DUF4124 domain-containing protein [Rhodocyclaceae bacterium]|nr:DUF4124 domain-containing protein [Rhodocyclaceae bacterium]
MLKQCLIILAPSLIAASLAAPASAEIYTWKDANGHVQYSDQPPPGVDAKPTHARAVAEQPTAVQSDAKAAPPAPKSMAEKDLEFRQRLADQADKAAKQKEEDARKQQKESYCNDVKRQLTAVESGARIGKTNDKGEMEIFGDDERKREGDKLRDQLAKDCK